MNPRWFFLFFLVSGFCSLVYEVVWLRLAMASFGVTTANVSMVLSIFMGGLALGSWAAGRLTVRLRDRPAAAPLRLYALAELVIGLSGIVVPPGLRLGHALLAGAGGSIEWGSASHHVASGAWIAIVLLPFGTAMGATFPLAMASLRQLGGAASTRSFSYLYLANVLGATLGTLMAAVFLIELLGFQGTLSVTSAMNALLAAGAFALSRSATQAARSELHTHKDSGDPRPPRAGRQATSSRTLGLLFLTGLTSMALEVVWVRQLTPFLGTVVYAFSTILVAYLLGTSLGSAAYRRWGAATGNPEGGTRMGSVWLAAGCCALLSLAGADPRWGGPGIGMASLARVLLAVGPFSAAVGFLTPLLVDRWSSGDPKRAGSAYALNVIGCILGPLLSSFVLLPWIGERWSSLVLSAPLLAAGLFALVPAAGRRSGARPRERSPGLSIAGCAALAASLLVLTRGFETVYPHAVVRRDATATVIAAGDGRDKQLLVNGYGMTVLTTITKTIAHLPLAFLPAQPRNTLVICFGMGTSFRSAMSWGVPATTVELIPSVPGLFAYFHADAAIVLARPGARVVIDDGRRFLERTSDSFDVITIDPPPPVEAAGSSLLYSREFYAAARPRLRPGGILQQWFPGEDPRVASAVARAIKESFRYVRVFRSFHGWGIHFLASDSPIPMRTAGELAGRLPGPAVADLVEWEPGESARSIFGTILSREIPLEAVIAADPNAPTLTDDRPVNEYYLVHRWRRQAGGLGLVQLPSRVVVNLRTMDPLTRRHFLGLASIAGIGTIAAPAGAAEAPGTPVAAPPKALSAIPDEFPTQAPALTREMVGVSHGNLARVNELLSLHPTLANAAWDWGFGDWESALGAASHMGNVDIARALLSNGARPSIFSAAMLGQLAVVRAFAEASPGVQGIRGPHGITLLAHARAGGDAAKPVLEYLVALGGADPVPKAVDLSPELAARYAGVYAFGVRESDRVEIAIEKGGVRFKRAGTMARNLVYLGDHAFHPAGAPAVRVRFALTGAGAAAELTVFDPELVLSARRVS